MKKHKHFSKKNNSNDSNEKIKKQTQKQTQKQYGGRFVGKGSYGCVISPAIPCTNIKMHKKHSYNKISNNKISNNKTSNSKTSNKLHFKHNYSLAKSNTTVSKIIINPSKEIKSEIALSNIIHKIDPNQNYFITFNNNCILKNIPDNRTNAVEVRQYSSTSDSDSDSNSNSDTSDKKYRIIGTRRKLDKKYCPIDLNLKPINLIMPYAGYDLIELVTKKSSNPLHLLILKNLPKSFKDCFKTLLTGIYKLHLNRIVNRDIKEENITANYNEKTGKVEMRFIDFGLSEHLTLEHCKNYNNIHLSGTPDFISPELIVIYYIKKYYDKTRDPNYIFKHSQHFFTDNNIKSLFSDLKESNIYNELNNVLNELIKSMYNDFRKHTILPKYFGSQTNKFNGYLQKADIYALGISMYEFLEVFSNFIDVKKDIKLHNLLKNMINLNPDKRYSIIDCLKHPYFK